MSSAEHIFDVVIVAPGKDGMPPVVLHHAPAIGAKDEGAAKVKAVEAAREAKVVFDIDFVEILVTRPFVDEVGCVIVTLPAYVPAPAPNSVRATSPLHSRTASTLLVMLMLAPPLAHPLASRASYTRTCTFVSCGPVECRAIEPLSRGSRSALSFRAPTRHSSTRRHSARISGT